MQITTTSGSASAPFIRSFSAVALIVASLAVGILLALFWVISEHDMERRSEQRLGQVIRKISELPPTSENIDILRSGLGLTYLSLAQSNGSKLESGGLSAADSKMSSKLPSGELLIAIDETAEKEALRNRMTLAVSACILMEIILFCGFWWLSVRSEAEIARREKESKEMESELFFLAHYDPVTNLPNRSLFWERLDAAIERSRRLEKSVALVAIELPSFKSICQEYGRSVGDAALLALSSRIQRCCRKEDFVCRIGPESFAILLEDIPVDQVKGALERFFSKLRPVMLEAWTVPDSSSSMSLDVSVGAVAFPDNGQTSETLLKAAEDSMEKIDRI